MSADSEDPVLAALLTRHRAVLTHERPALLRTDQVMVRVGDLANVPSSLRRWLEDPAPPRAGMHRVRLRADHDCDLLGLLDSAGHRVRPIHLLRAAPRWRGSPAGPPVRIDDGPAAPPAPDPDLAAIRVAILDTGITPHPWFRCRPWFADVTPDQIEVLDLVRDGAPESVAGHGTFVAGVVQEQAPSAVLRIYRVLGPDGVCDELDLIEALHGLGAAPEGVPEVVNLSFGGFTCDDRPTEMVVEAIAALARRTVVVAAAGNEDSERPFWPAALPDVIAVAALDARGLARAGFSDHGPWVDACAVGEDLRGAFVPTGGESADEGFSGCGAFARWSGTSFAAPTVSGDIAALAALARISARQAADRLLAAGRARESGLGVVIDSPTQV
jgi:subtilisin family serine protease